MPRNFLDSEMKSNISITGINTFSWVRRRLPDHVIHGTEGNSPGSGMSTSAGNRSFHSDHQLSILALRLLASSDEMIFCVMPSSGSAPPLSYDRRQTSSWRRCESNSFLERKP